MDTLDTKKVEDNSPNAYTPNGSVFSNPNIGSEWIYMVEKDTGRKYYRNIKTSEVVYNLTKDSQLAPRWRRVCAASIDMGIALAGGIAVSFLASIELNDVSLGYVIGRIYSSLFFAAKDCLLDHGTRSIGKKLMKLEIVSKSGELSGPYRNFFRNPLELCVSFTNFLGLQFFMLNNALVVIDVVLFAIFKKRVFDFTLGTRVVPETKDHAMRVKLYHDKKTYKRLSESLEEASMSGLQQMMKQQKQYDANVEKAREIREKAAGAKGKE